MNCEKKKVTFAFFSVKVFETLGPLEVKDSVKIYWKDSIKSYCNF